MGPAPLLNRHPLTPMPSHADLQGAFAAALRDPARPVPAAIVVGSEGPRARGFDVHRNNVAVSLTEALQAAFPVVRRLVGEDFFKAAAKAYMTAEPPRSPVMLLYGEGFGDFMDGFPPAREVPYLGDVARLEWARLYAYHAADAPVLEISRLAEIPEAALGDLRFALHPSLRLVRSRWPVVSIWAASNGQGSAETVDMSIAQEAAVIRPALEVDLRLLPPGGHGFMDALMTGATLAEAAERASQQDTAFALADHLQGLFQIGAVTALRQPGPDSPTRIDER